MSSSISFRISRSTEDLAETIHALSQRLLTLEQRLSGFEALLNREPEAPDASELERLERVELLLQDCRDLLDLPGATGATRESAATAASSEQPSHAQAPLAA